MLRNLSEVTQLVKQSQDPNLVSVSKAPEVNKPALPVPWEQNGHEQPMFGQKGP